MITAAYWILHEQAIAMNAFISVLIIACPCALALSIPFAFGHAMRIFGRHGLYLKNTDCVEALSSINQIIFDKTGTLTSSQGWNVNFAGAPLSKNEKQLIKSLVKHSTHPLSNAIYRFLNAEIIEPQSFEEFPGKGISGIIQGTNVRIGSNAFMNDEVKKDDEVESSKVFVSFETQTRGVFIIEKKYRKGLKQLITELLSRFQLFLLSGDNDADRKELSQLLIKNDHMHFRFSPEEKLEFVRQKMLQGNKVLMVGDGLNDAGALRQSDVGIAVSDDIYSFSPSCDAILHADSFGKLGKFLKTSKKTMQIVKMSFLLSFIYNVAGLWFAVQGILTPLVAAILMPLSSVTVVLFVTLMVRWTSSRAGL
jgi:Cu+-exporting ATPase